MVNTFNTFFNEIIANFGTKVIYAKYLYLSSLYYEKYLCNASDISAQLLWFIQPIKKTEKRKNQAIDQLVFFLIYLKFMTEFFMTKCILISVIFFLNIKVIFIRDMVPNTAS